jgi:Polysaccharide deacetylase
MQSLEPPKGWPANRPLAISVNVMLEAWTDGAAPAIGPMGNPLQTGVLDLQARSWAEYGPKAGAWRLLDILAKAGVAAVFYTSGICAERYPQLIAAIVSAGHAVAAHGWAQDLIPAYQDAETEKADIGRCAAALESAAGRRPLGWLSPRCTPSPRTSELLARAGFFWQADFFDSDLPYMLATPGGPITAIPFSMEVNDLPLYIRHGNEPESFTRVLEKIVSHWPRLGLRPGCLDLTVHAHVFGRPYGAIEFARCLEMIRSYAEWGWLTHHDALARLYR